MDKETLLLNTLKVSFRSAFAKAVAETPFVVVMDQPADLQQLQDLHEFARDAAIAAWAAKAKEPGFRDMTGDFQGMLYPRENAAPLRWITYSHEYLARAYAQAMEKCGVDSTIYKIEQARGEACLSPLPHPASP